MADHCEPMATTGEDGEPIRYRAQVGPDFTDADKAALDEVVRSAVRHMATIPRCLDCGHRTDAHLADGCRVRVRQNGHGHRCGCTSAPVVSTEREETR